MQLIFCLTDLSLVHFPLDYAISSRGKDHLNKNFAEFVKHQEPLSFAFFALSHLIFVSFLYNSLLFLVLIMTLPPFHMPICPLDAFVGYLVAFAVHSYLRVGQ